MKQPVVLKIYRGGKLETVRQFESGPIVIGRDGEVGLKLSDDSVSLLHAMIEERSDGTYTVTDLGSKTGTIRNGALVLEEQISSGDELQIGIFKVQFSAGVPRPMTVAPKVIETPVLAAPDAFHDDETTEITVPTEAPPPVQPVIRAPVVKPSAAAPKIEVEAKPQAPALTDLSKSPGRKHKTFAPPSPYRDARDIIKPGKGSVVEVLVLWKERVLSTHHFTNQASVTIGGPSADVFVPILSSSTQFEFLKIQGSVAVCLSSEMTGEMIRGQETVSFAELANQNKMRGSSGLSELDLRQGEMVRVHLKDTISLMVRYKTDSPKPAIAPIIDLSKAEVTGVLLAVVVSAIFAFYMSLYAPSSLLDDEANVEEPIRKAVVQFQAPKHMEMLEEKPEPPKPVEKKVVEVKEKQKQIKADVKSAEIKAPHKQEASAKAVEKKGDPGKAGDVAPRPDQNKKNAVTSSRPGGATKTAPKEGANMASAKPDPTKVGLLGVFSSKGTQSKLDKAYSGSGELQGMAQQANGMAGSNENRAGDVMGTKLKDTGGGGKGTNTIGIAGVGTNGRGTGNTGYGTGGIGSKGSVKVDVGGQDADFTGSIDRDAIRRVILAHKAEIRFCYDKELQKNPDLAGKVVIGWNIGEDGRVTKASVTSNALGSDAVANCIVNKIKTFVFPAAPPDVEAHVSYPFVFSSN